jgi:hypothetical protein
LALDLKIMVKRCHIPIESSFPRWLCEPA